MSEIQPAVYSVALPLAIWRQSPVNTHHKCQDTKLFAQREGLGIYPL